MRRLQPSRAVAKTVGSIAPSLLPLPMQLPLPPRALLHKRVVGESARVASFGRWTQQVATRSLLCVNHLFFSTLHSILRNLLFTAAVLSTLPSPSSSVSKACRLREGGVPASVSLLFDHPFWLLSGAFSRMIARWRLHVCRLPPPLLTPFALPLSFPAVHGYTIVSGCTHLTHATENRRCNAIRNYLPPPSWRTAFRHVGAPLCRRCQSSPSFSCCVRSPSPHLSP